MYTFIYYISYTRNQAFSLLYYMIFKIKMWRVVSAVLVIGKGFNVIIQPHFFSRKLDSSDVNKCLEEINSVNKLQTIRSISYLL